MSPDIWQGLTDVLAKAIPVLESQSFAWKSPAASYEHSSSNLIAQNYFPLVKDIERLNDLCTIARNLLATTKKAQNLAAEKGFDQRILALIDTCVRVTARGFDGETNARNEERWQKVVNLYKRLLITCLQYLHNFIMHNEQRKMVLWLDLFGYHSTADTNIIKPKEALDPASRIEGVAPIVRIGTRASRKRIPLPASIDAIIAQDKRDFTTVAALSEDPAYTRFELELDCVENWEHRNLDHLRDSSPAEWHFINHTSQVESPQREDNGLSWRLINFDAAEVEVESQLPEPVTWLPFVKALRFSHRTGAEEPRRLRRRHLGKIASGATGSQQYVGGSWETSEGHHNAGTRMTRR